MRYWKSLIILKEVKKPRGTFLRVWAKNKARFENSWEIFEIYIGKSQWKIDFLAIFSPIFQDLSRFIQLWKIAPFSTTIFFRLGESSPPPPPTAPAGEPDYRHFMLFSKALFLARTFPKVVRKSFLNWFSSKKFQTFLKISQPFVYFVQTSEKLTHGF